MKSYILGFALAILVGGLFFVFVVRQPTEQESVGSSQKQEQQTQKTPMVTDLKIEDITVGTGQEVKTGDTAFVHYTGTFLDGQTFDSSLTRGAPLQFKVGAGQVIQGWDQGIVGMKVGGKRKLTIPPALAYGEQGAGGVIPPNATLVFEVELVDVQWYNR